MMVSVKVAEIIFVAFRGLSSRGIEPIYMYPHIPFSHAKNHHTSERLSQEWYLSSLEHVKKNSSVRT